MTNGDELVVKMTGWRKQPGLLDYIDEHLDRDGLLRRIERLRKELSKFEDRLANMDKQTSDHEDRGVQASRDEVLAALRKSFPAASEEDIERAMSMLHYDE